MARRTTDSSLMDQPLMQSTTSRVANLCGNCQRPQATLRCSRCKEECYCDAACQKAKWSQHKFYCEMSVTSKKFTNEVDIVGQAYEIKSRPEKKPNFDFAGVGRRRMIGDLGPNYGNQGGLIWKSPICYSMGIPLIIVHEHGLDRMVNAKDPAARARAVKEGRAGGNQFFTYLMADPVTGYANPEFQVGLGNCEIVRADGKDITDADALFLWSTFDRVMDVFSMGRGGPKNYKKFFEAEQEEFNAKAQEDNRTTFMDLPPSVEEAAQMRPNPSLQQGP